VLELIGKLKIGVCAYVVGGGVWILKDIYIYIYNLQSNRNIFFSISIFSIYVCQLNVLSIPSVCMEIL
jgi:hypothetical protein